MQLLDGLQHIHTHSLIHRDLTPANIFLTNDKKTVKIGDFGLSREMVSDALPAVASTSADLAEAVAEIEASAAPPTIGKSASFLRRADMKERMKSVTRGVGTTLYMSPEQRQRKPYDHKVDIYSAGVVLLEMCHPFSTGMERVIVLSDLQLKHALPSGMVNTPEGELILSMTHESPDHRPSIDELIASPLLAARGHICVSVRRSEQYALMPRIRDEIELCEAVRVKSFTAADVAAPSLERSPQLSGLGGLGGSSGVGGGSAGGASAGGSFSASEPSEPWVELEYFIEPLESDEKKYRHGLERLHKALTNLEGVASVKGTLFSSMHISPRPTPPTHPSHPPFGGGGGGGTARGGGGGGASCPAAMGTVAHAHPAWRRSPCRRRCVSRCHWATAMAAATAAGTVAAAAHSSPADRRRPSRRRSRRRRRRRSRRRVRRQVGARMSPRPRGRRPAAAAGRSSSAARRAAAPRVVSDALDGAAAAGLGRVATLDAATPHLAEPSPAHRPRASPTRPLAGKEGLGGDGGDGGDGGGSWGKPAVGRSPSIRSFSLDHSAFNALEADDATADVDGAMDDAIEARAEAAADEYAAAEERAHLFAGFRTPKLARGASLPASPAKANKSDGRVQHHLYHHGVEQGAPSQAVEPPPTPQQRQQQQQSKPRRQAPAPAGQEHRAPPPAAAGSASRRTRQKVVHRRVRSFGDVDEATMFYS